MGGNKSDCLGRTVEGFVKCAGDLRSICLLWLPETVEDGEVVQQRSWRCGIFGLCRRNDSSFRGRHWSPRCCQYLYIRMWNFVLIVLYVDVFVGVYIRSTPAVWPIRRIKPSKEPPPDDIHPLGYPNVIIHNRWSVCSPEPSPLAPSSPASSPSRLTDSTFSCT